MKELWRPQIANDNEFYTFIDTIAQRLRSSGFVKDADSLNSLLHQTAWFTSKGFFDELRFCLRTIREERTFLDAALSSEIAAAIEAIDSAVPESRQQSEAFFQFQMKDFDMINKSLDDERKNRGKKEFALLITCLLALLYIYPTSI